MSSARDPRKSVRYARTVEVIQYLQTYTTATLDQICIDLGLSREEFRQARYSLPGCIAMEDYDVIIPRPVREEGFVYKLATIINTGDVDTDPELNFQTSFGDVLTRLATIYVDVERDVDKQPPRSAVRKLLRKLQKSLDTTLDRAEDVAVDAEAPISRKAQYVLDKIA